MKVTLLGTGTSIGVPEMGCTCEVCTSQDPHDHRLRTSAWVETDAGEQILIDCGPDFREQVLRLGFKPLNGVLLTHEHYDHDGGIDDLRPYTRTAPLPLYANLHTGRSLRARLPYLFAEKRYPGTPDITLHTIRPRHPFLCGRTEILPFPVRHGQLSILGYRIGALGYITDCSHLPDESLSALRGITHLVINALHFKPHASHQSLSEALELIADIGRIAPLQAAYLIHVTHRIGLHRETTLLLPPHVHLGHDGHSFTV
jgi:phosphoribosyl 1,2-cyclic phosphate phosphodiesterase